MTTSDQRLSFPISGDWRPSNDTHTPIPLALIEHPTLSAQAKVVGMQVIRHIWAIEPAGELKFDVDTLIRESALSRADVMRCIKTLEDVGLFAFYRKMLREHADER